MRLVVRVFNVSSELAMLPASVQESGETALRLCEPFEHPQVRRERPAAVDEALAVRREAEAHRRAQIAAGCEAIGERPDHFLRTRRDLDGVEDLAIVLQAESVEELAIL